MRSVNVAELKNRLSKYLTFAKGGEEIVIRDRNLPVASAYSDIIASETYHRAGLVIASNTTVRWSPSGFSAAEMTTFVSITSRSGIIGS